MNRIPIVLGSLGVVFALAACNKDDASVTARAQGAVNIAMSSPDSDVQVAVHDGVATLTGVASSTIVRTRAEQAAMKVEGVESVNDEITTPTILTGAVVPAAKP